MNERGSGQRSLFEDLRTGHRVLAGKRTAGEGLSGRSSGMPTGKTEWAVGSWGRMLEAGDIRVRKDDISS